MLEGTDKHGNIVVIDDYGSVTLKLKQPKKHLAYSKRHIGNISKEALGLRYTKAINNSQIMKIDDSIGINHTVLELLPGTTEVVVLHKEGLCRYRLTVKEILEKGHFKKFRKKGYELQVFVPRSEWITERI